MLLVLICWPNGWLGSSTDAFISNGLHPCSPHPFQLLLQVMPAFRDTRASSCQGAEGKGSSSSVLTWWDCVESTHLAGGLSGNNSLKFNLLSQIIPQGFLEMFSWSSRISSVLFAVSSVAFLFVNNTWLSVSNYLRAWNIYFYPDDLLVSLFLFVSILHTSEVFIHRQKNLLLSQLWCK